MTLHAFPATWSQRSMWASSLRARSAPLDVFTSHWLLEGPLDIALLREALRLLWQRHPALRSTLVLRNGALLCVEGAFDDVPLQSVDFGGLNQTDALQSAMDRVRNASTAPINLAAGPAARIELARLGDRCHLLSWILHHAFCDGWSLQLLAAQWSVAYASLSAGHHPDQTWPVPQEADLAETSTAHGEVEAYAEELDYWNDRLRQLGPPPQLPGRRSSKGLRDFRCQTIENSCEAPLQDRLREQARAHRTTVFSLLVAALAIQVHARTGACDLLFGVSTLNRWSEVALQQVGSRTNLLPLRLEIASSQGLHDLIRQVHVRMRELIAHGRVPVERILHQLREAGEPLQMPIWCQYRESAPSHRPPGTSLTLTPLPIERPALTCDVEVDWLSGTDGLRSEWAYRDALFDKADMAARLVDERRILELVVDGVDRPVREMAVLLT